MFRLNTRRSACKLVSSRLCWICSGRQVYCVYLSSVLIVQATLLGTSNKTIWHIRSDLW